MSNFKFKTPIQLRYSDFDMLGHLNSAQYVTIIELGRLEYFRHINWNLKEVSNVVAQFSIEYLKQIVPGDLVEVQVRIPQLGTKSFKMDYEVVSPDGQTCYAKAQSTQVCILKKGNTSTPIPKSIRIAIQDFETI